MAMKKPSKGAGRKDGNVIVDLGEEIDKKISSAAVAAARSERAEMGRPGGYRPGMFGGYRPGGYRPGGYRPGMFGGRSSRPGMFGGYRPWYADREGSGGTMGMKNFMKEEVTPISMLGGLALGVIGNRALLRVTPDIIGTTMEVAHTGIAFVVGLIPALVKPNAITVGVALPGAVYFAGSLVDWAMNKIGIQKKVLSGSAEAPQQRGGADAALAARQRLADLQQRIQPAQQQYSGNPRAVAYAQ
jgi:hypothetical protein